MTNRIPVLLSLAFLLPFTSLAQTPVTLTVDTASHGYAIPADFSGLGFETKSAVPNEYGVSGYFFTPENAQLIRLFQNMGIKNIRVGGGTVDGSGRNERCVTPTPTETDIDHLFAFARAAGIDVIYSVRLLNVDACADPHLAAEDARIAKYVWNKYRPTVTSLAIGNEPDVRQYHTYPGHASDSAIAETRPGISGSAYPSYFADWRLFADVILKSVPNAKFSGPDTAVSSTSSFTPDPATGMSWTEKFAADLKNTGILAEVLQHHYVWGNPGSTTAEEAIDDMLSSEWDNDATIGTQPAMNGGKAEFHPYPFVYNRVLSSLVPMGVPYRMTEANDCLHGVPGASNGYAAALWALDYMHWWASHHMAGVNFHNNPWLPTDTVVPDPNPCPPSGCANYRITAKGYGLKAFDVGSHGYEMPIAISNPTGMNLTAYAVGTDQDVYVTIINRTHSTTHDVAGAAVTIGLKDFRPASARAMVLSGDRPGDARSMTATLGGATITNDARWLGKWTPLGRVENGRINVTVQSTTAVVVKIHSAGAYAGPIQADQNGDLELFRTGADGEILRAQIKTTGASTEWNRLDSEVAFKGAPVIVRNEDNELEVFLTSADGRVYHNNQTSPDGSWSGWSALGNDRIADLVGAENADGSVSIFGIGEDGDLWIDSESAPGVGWTGWQNLGGEQIEPGFTVGQSLSGRLEVFGVDKLGTVRYRSQTDSGGWSEWTSLGGNVHPYLGVGSNLDGCLEIFAIGVDGRLTHLRQKRDGEWGQWKALNGPRIGPGFVVGQFADGRLVVFVTTKSLVRDSIESRDPATVGRKQVTWTISQQSAGGLYSKWSSLGGAGSMALAVGNDDLGRIRLFGFGDGSAIWVNRQSESASGWTGWTRMSPQPSIKPDGGRP